MKVILHFTLTCNSSVSSLVYWANWMVYRLPLALCDNQHNLFTILRTWCRNNLNFSRSSGLPIVYFYVSYCDVHHKSVNIYFISLCLPYPCLSVHGGGGWVCLQWWPPSVTRRDDYVQGRGWVCPKREGVSMSREGGCKYVQRGWVSQVSWYTPNRYWHLVAATKTHVIIIIPVCNGVFPKWNKIQWIQRIHGIW